MSTPTAAAIYARISSDPDDTRLGVQRQVQDCRELAEREGWIVAEEYIDNDISAYSGKRRPAYERMLTDLADGFRDGLIVYHQDRLTRRPIELEQFLDVTSRAGVKHVRFVAGAGELDLANGDGLMVLRLLAAVAANESATKSRRVARRIQQRAEQGLPQGGNRPFGFAADKITHHPVEAEIVRTLAARYLAGESARSLTAWLQAEGVSTVTGKAWISSTLLGVLKSPRIAGLREHRGEVIGPAVWEPIITVEDHHRIVASMAQRRHSGRRTPRRYLLTGLLRCGLCDGTLYSSARKDRRRYVCLAGPDHGGCGRLTIIAPQLEELVTDAVLYRLDTPELAAALDGRASTDDQARQLADDLAAERAQLDELAGAYAAKQITMREWLTARRPIEDRIDDIDRRLNRLTRNDALTGLIGNGDTLRHQWSELNLSRQHAIVRALLDHGVIAPRGNSGPRQFDRERVSLVWRV